MIPSLSSKCASSIRCLASTTQTRLRLRMSGLTLRKVLRSERRRLQCLVVGLLGKDEELCFESLPRFVQRGTCCPRSSSRSCLSGWFSFRWPSFCRGTRTCTRSAHGGHFRLRISSRPLFRSRGSPKAAGENPDSAKTIET